LGWADIYILNGRDIIFKGSGEETNIGTRVDSPTVGMDIDQGDIMDIGDSGMPAPSQGVSRVRISKKKPKRKVRRRDDFSALTSLKGMRW